MPQSYITSRRPCPSCSGPQVRIERRLADRILFYLTLSYLRRRRYQCMQCGREETAGANELTAAASNTASR